MRTLCPNIIKPRESAALATGLLCCLLSALPAAAQDDYSYTPNADGTLNIQSYSGSGGNVAIPGANDGQSVTSIGNDAFYQITNLTGVIIPDSITNIGIGAFYLCTGLTNVAMGNAVATVSAGAFECCSSLTSVTIPDGVSYIGEEAFLQCLGLTCVTIGTNVSSIGDYAFYDCPALRRIRCNGRSPWPGSARRDTRFLR